MQEFLIENLSEKNGEEKKEDEETISHFLASLWAAVKINAESQSMEQTSGQLDSFPSPTEGLRAPGSTTDLLHSSTMSVNSMKHQ